MALPRSLRPAGTYTPDTVGRCPANGTAFRGLLADDDRHATTDHLVVSRADRTVIAVAPFFDRIEGVKARFVARTDVPGENVGLDGLGGDNRRAGLDAAVDLVAFALVLLLALPAAAAPAGLGSGLCPRPVCR